MRRIIHTVLVLVASLQACKAELSVFDFEGGSFCGPKIVAGYVQIENSRGTICYSGFTGNSSNKVSSGSISTSDVNGLLVRHFDGLAFTPVSMRVAEFSLSVDPSGPLTLTGLRDDGSEISMDIVLDGVRDGIGGEEDFEAVMFPVSFANIVRLEFEASSWSLDDLVIDAPATPTIVPGPVPTGHFLSATRLLNSPGNLTGRFMQSLVLMEHYTYLENPGSVSAVVDARGSGVEIVLSPVIASVVDPVTHQFYQSPGTEDDEVILLHEVSEDPVEIRIETVRLLGYDVTDIKPVAAYDGTLLFMGTNFSGSDSYDLLTYKDGVIEAVVTPTTELPGESGGVFNPWNFPSDATMGPGGIAFDTSTTESTGDEVVFERPSGSTSFRRLLTEGDETGFGVVRSISRVEYFGSDLVIDATTVLGNVRMVYQNGVQVSSAIASINQPIVGEEVLFIGKVEEHQAAPRIVSRVNEMFRDIVYWSDGEQLHRVIGPGSTVMGSEVRSASYRATSQEDPNKILVYLWLADFELSGLFEIEIGEPDSPAIAIGETFFWPDPHLFAIPVNYATKGRVYTLHKSIDLVNWEIHSVIDEFDVRPRFLFPVDDEEHRFFFAVEESERFETP